MCLARNPSFCLAGRNPKPRGTVDVYQLDLCSHPQTELPARGSSRYPVVGRMELSDGRNGGDAVAAKLCQLLAFRSVDVNETIHVANAEPLDGVGRLCLPLSTKATMNQESVDAIVSV